MTRPKNRLFIYEDESIEGYLYRTAVSNYVALHEINKYISPCFRMGVGDVKGALLLLNEENEFFYARNSIYFLYHYGLLQYISHKQNYSKFCPACLCEKSYHEFTG